MMAFYGGEPPRAAWYGALVGRRDERGIEFAFDDGDIKLFSMEELQRDFDGGALEALDASKGGLVNNDANLPAAAGFVRVGKARALTQVDRCAGGQVRGAACFWPARLHGVLCMSTVRVPSPPPLRRLAAALHRRCRTA